MNTNIDFFFPSHQICAEKGVSPEEVRKEVKAILDEMAHNLNMTAIRHFAYVLVKVFKALFQRVYVNEEGVQMVGEFLQSQTPTPF